jgi:fructose-bisphosphate aldolase class II
LYDSMNLMLQQAREKEIGVPAFNIHALEVVPMMAQTASEKNCSVILQVSVGTAKYIGFKLLAVVVKTVAQDLPITVALHLDHADNLSDIEAALKAGFSSVMYDGSRLPLEENIANTRQAVKLAREAGASIEAELGIVGRGKVVEEYPYTDPEDARSFVKETGVDALAVGIGTHHGQYKAKTNLNFDVLEKIHSVVDIPLVLHGGTGVRDEDVRRCISQGMYKLNFGTELNVSWVRQAKDTFGKAEVDDSLRNLMKACNEAMADVIRRKISLVRF